MKIEYKERYKIVTPEEGMILRNGNLFSDFIYMPLDEDLNKWDEVPSGEYKA